MTTTEMIVTQPAWVNRCRRLAESIWFQNFILAVIVLVAVVMGLETSPFLMRRYGTLFHAINVAVQAIFLFEIAVRFTAYYPRLVRFFSDGWNVFDLLIVAASLLPEAGAYATVARIARLLRVARLVSVSSELRLIISTMLRSIPSLGNVTLLLALLLYIYGIIGYHLFHETDPQNWGTLGQSILTLFQMLTLEGWVEVQNASMEVYPWAWLFYGSYVIVAVFVVVNLFVAVVLNNLENAKMEQEQEKFQESSPELATRLASLRAELDALEEVLQKTST